MDIIVLKAQHIIVMICFLEGAVFLETEWHLVDMITLQRCLISIEIKIWSILP